MSKPKLSIRNHYGQIIIEALVVSVFMFIIMMAFHKLIALKKEQPKPYQKTIDKVLELNLQNNNYVGHQ